MTGQYYDTISILWQIAILHCGSLLEDWDGTDEVYEQHRYTYSKIYSGESGWEK